MNNRLETSLFLKKMVLLQVPLQHAGMKSTNT